MKNELYDLGAWTVARLLIGQSADLDRLEEPWRSLAEQVIGANGGDRKEAFLRAVGERDDAGELQTAVFAADPTREAPSRKPAPEMTMKAEMPALPASARLSDAVLASAEGVGSWLTDYVAYAEKRSPMTPETFHEAAGLWLGGVAIARRLYCPLSFDDIWPNLYILWVAKTTIFRKTTAFKLVSQLANEVLEHLLLPQEFTPEALLSELAGKDPLGIDDAPQDHQDLWRARQNFSAQRGMIMDEFSGVLASARKDYNAGLTETILRLHDCPLRWERRTQTHGLIRVQRPYLSILSATTLKALRPHLADHAWLSGFWPRFALLYPDKERPDYQYVRERPETPAGLTEHLNRLACNLLPYPAFPRPPEAQAVKLSGDALGAWERYSKAVGYDLLTNELDEKLWGLYGRLPVQGVKVATVLAALDWDGEDTPVITLAHWAKAQQIVEGWRASVHRLLVPEQAQAEQAFEEKLMDVVRRFGDPGMTARNVARYAHCSRNQVEPVLDRLVRDDLLTSSVPEGRKAKQYYVS